jgi:CO/xanthine dehydrogenase Mo-binding subunit
MIDRFQSDIEFPDQYYGVLVRSSIQRGRLVDIKLPRMNDGYHFYSATDIPGENRITAMGTSMPIFTPYEIQYFGEPLGIIVGPDLATVQELAGEVLIETEKLDPIEFTEKFTSSQIIAKRILLKGDPDSFFDSDPNVFESTSEIGPQDHFYAEPLGVNVNIASGKLEIYTATQWPFHVRSSVSSVLDLEPDEIVVVPTMLAEAMDGKIWYPSLLASQAALASVLCKRPVKICLTRQEDFLFTGKSAPAQIRYRTSIGVNGNIEAMLVRVLVNAGAFSPLVDEIVDRIAVAATGLYAIASCRIEVYALRTSLPPLGALAGWGEAQVFFALETHLAQIISRLGLSPVEWKLMNLLDRGMKTSTGNQITEDFGYDHQFAKICTNSDFPRKFTAYELLNKNRPARDNGPLRGIALTVAYQGNGFLGRTYENSPYSAEVTIATDGIVKVDTMVYSASMRDVLSAIVSEILGIDKHMVQFSGMDTTAMSECGPETLSSKIAIIAPLVEKCCETIQKQRFRQPLPITVRKTYKPSKKDVWDSKALTGKPYVSLTSGACIVELEMDPVTYDTTVRGIWLSCNPGKLYNERHALTAVRKSVQLALSKTVAEHILIKDGKLSPKESVQYDVLPPSCIPASNIFFIGEGEIAKGVGSIAVNLIPAAYAAALAQITGKQITELPVERRHVYESFAGKDAQA